MRNVRRLAAIAVLLMTLGVTAAEPVSLDQAKLLLFDEKWAAALKVLDRVLAENPSGQELTQALYYRAGCLKELKRDRDAIQAYLDFLDVSRNDALNEEAHIAIVDLSYRLAGQGDDAARARLVGYLAHRNQTVRYYAAFRLSYMKDKALAMQAVPVLRQVLTSERDPELKERARLALLRINPDMLKQASPPPEPSGAVLKIRIVEKRSGASKVSITIPLSLARLALAALPAEEKQRLAADGYDLDTILEQLSKANDVIRIEDEEATIRIWVENQ